jgi:hypothetical protein
MNSSRRSFQAKVWARAPVVGEVADLGLRLRQGVDRHRKYHAQRLVLVEADAAAPGHLPVHRERIGQPMRLDDAGQRRDAVLGAVDRSRREQVPSGIGPEEVTQMERDDAIGEVRHRKVCQVRVTVERADGHARGSRSAIPLDRERAG